MKFLKYLVALVIGVTMSVSLASCGDDDDEPQSSTKNESQSGTNSSYETLIIGEWYYTEGGFMMAFYTGGKGYWYEYDDRDSGNFSWSISGNRLFMDYSSTGDGSEYYTIVKITEDVLILENEDGGIDVYDRMS